MRPIKIASSLFLDNYVVTFLKEFLMAHYPFEPFRIKVAEVLIELYQNRDQIVGLRLIYEAPYMRHFTARLEPIDQLSR